MRFIRQGTYNERKDHLDNTYRPYNKFSANLTLNLDLTNMFFLPHIISLLGKIIYKYVHLEYALKHGRKLHKTKTFVVIFLGISELENGVTEQFLNLLTTVSIFLFGLYSVQISHRIDPSLPLMPPLKDSLKVIPFEYL